jgi:NAD(P)-dependent dehydrogenase (short-subunit alcohol dehydrogenase family)
MQISKAMAAIVTGGASGLGEATARALAAAGAKVTVFDMNEERGQAVARELGGTFAKVDVSSGDSVSAGLEIARAAHGQERIVVNCAGIAIGEKTASIDKKTGEARFHALESFQKTIAVNLTGTFNMISKCAAGMIDSRTCHCRWRARGDHKHRVHCRGRGADRPGGLRRVEGRRDRHDAAGGARPDARWYPLLHNHAGAVSHANGGGSTGRGSGITGGKRAVSGAPRRSGRVCEARSSYHR